MPDRSETLQQLTVPRYAPRLGALPIPTAAWNDEPLYCLELNDQWVSHVLGVMIALDQPDTWVGTDDEIFAARQQVNEIMAAFMEACMDCCGSPEIPMTRVDSNGHFQQSVDGGTTWTDAPQFDPRNSIPQTPPNPTTDSDGAKCAYADSVVQHFKAGFVDVVEEGATVEAVMGFLTGIAEAIFGPLTGPIGWIIPALFAIATAIVAFGIVAFKAAFNDDVWNKLRCLIFDNIESDGSFTISGLDNIYGMIDTVATDVIAQVTIRSWIAAIGVTGMTNAAHIGLGNPTLCDDCGCDCPVTWTWYNCTAVQDEDDENTWHITPDGGLHFAFSSGDNTLGCYCANDVGGLPSQWHIGSNDPTTGWDTRDAKLWNFDTNVPDATPKTFTFSSCPIPH